VTRHENLRQHFLISDAPEIGQFQNRKKKDPELEIDLQCIAWSKRRDKLAVSSP
jgi:hypothetical protein